MRQPEPETAAVSHPGSAFKGLARVKVIFLLGVLSAFGPLSIDMYLPALPSLQSHFHATASQVQLTLTACLIGLALGQMLAGPLSDSFGRRRPLLVGVSAFALASLLCAVAPSIALLTVGRLIQGIAGSAGIVLAQAVVRDLYSGTAMLKFFSTLMLVNGAAPILAPVVGSQLLRVTGWQGLFVVLAGIGVALFIGVYVDLPESLPIERRRSASLSETTRAFRSLAADRRFVGYALAGGLGFAAMFAYISGSPFVAEQVYGLSPQAFSVFFGVNALGIILIGQVNGWLAGKVAPARLLQTGLVQCAVGGAGLIAVTVAGLGFWPTAVCLWVVVASMGFLLPSTAALALAGQADNAGTASAFIGVARFLLGALAAPLTGPGAGSVLAKTLPMATVVAALGVAALLVYVVLVRRAPEDAAERVTAGDTVRQAI
ncbi:MAG TPA: multidrug effflux MFS transporter [Actinocrinis sp.]|uniref:multidrug effflux MFS transporter n=1 Tax=Actinocrinis sp. TaxID=1920516 RepID=UPI002DDD91AC|nr:multidrug effflux MFS transporter [Actinocrinis sp.]HEV3173911.1 multidrug effflux MFS transporter [Actinocrinis sp.]